MVLSGLTSIFLTSSNYLQKKKDVLNYGAYSVPKQSVYPNGQAFFNFKTKNEKQIFTCFLNLDLKSCVRYIFASLFFKSKRAIMKLWKNVFYFTSKALFILEKTKSQKFRYSNMMSSNANKKYILLSNLGINTVC